MTPTTSASLRWRYQRAKSFSPWIVSATTAAGKPRGIDSFDSTTQPAAPRRAASATKLWPSWRSPRIAQNRSPLSTVRESVAMRPNATLSASTAAEWPPVAAKSSLKVTRSMSRCPAGPKASRTKRTKVISTNFGNMESCCVRGDRCLSFTLRSGPPRRRGGGERGPLAPRRDRRREFSGCR